MRRSPNIRKALRKAHVCGYKYAEDSNLDVPNPGLVRGVGRVRAARITINRRPHPMR